MSFPTVVALDTDWTIWQNVLDASKWGKGRGAQSIQQDNIFRVDSQTLQDTTNKNNWIRVYNDVSRIINDILKNGAQLAIVSRNTSRPMCDRALYYFNAVKPDDGKEWSIIDLVKYDEIKNESKTLAFRRINGWSMSDYVEMVHFDDEAMNNEVRIVLGVTFQLVRDKKGISWDVYQEGINAWRRSKEASILSNPPSQRRRVLIGYSGLPDSWINLVRTGEGTIDTGTPYRWGYALYVSSNIPMSKFFVKWNGIKSYVCEVWVNDYEAWLRLNKIWVPESNGNLPQMNNQSWSYEQTGLNQENRDRFIANAWKVYTPYVLFSRHFWVAGMPLPKTRWTEMVVYTQPQRYFYDVVPLTDAQVNATKNQNPYPFEQQIKTWNITVPPETRAEFLRNGEKDLYNASA